MKLSVSSYVVGLVVSFVYAIVKYYVPTLPLSEDFVQWVFLTILAVAGVDVTAALKAGRSLR